MFAHWESMVPLLRLLMVLQSVANQETALVLAVAVVSAVLVPHAQLGRDSVAEAQASALVEHEAVSDACVAVCREIK